MIRTAPGCLVILAAALAASCSFEPNPGRVAEGPIEGMEFAWIPSGTFAMGSPPTEAERFPDEGPVRMVTIEGFELMTTEVTQAMWQQLIGSNPSHGCGEGPTWPVYSVSWNACQEFIAALNEMDPSYVYRLPSEAEWEYACRAGTQTPYSWGATMTEGYCWYSGNSGSSTQPVAKKLPNAWALYDMSGNVCEWCQDWFHADLTSAPIDGSAWEMPAGTNRVLRGGSWADEARYCRSAYRLDYNPAQGFSNMGFRVARSER
jgi:formylglycine-generating enzyme required for sulfatase activity